MSDLSDELESVLDLDERIEGLLLMVLGDDLHQEGVLALGQLDEGADAVDVGVDFDVEDVVLPWGEAVKQTDVCVKSS